MIDSINKSPWSPTFLAVLFNVSEISLAKSAGVNPALLPLITESTMKS